MFQPRYFLGIDVGTSSARVVLADEQGRVVSSSGHNIKTFRDPNDHRIYEQSTEDIWQSICVATRAVLNASQISPQDVHGIGIDATCSLAVVDASGTPISVNRHSLGDPSERNIILWCDHRAEAQARRINGLGHAELKVLGGSMDLELDIPKIKWLQENMAPEDLARATFFCLPDYLACRAISTIFRSQCTEDGKPSYPLPTTHYSSPNGWSPDFFETIGMPEFIPARSEIEVSPGLPLGHGLSQQAASELGLRPGIAVGAAVVDCYAGYFATIATQIPGGNTGFEACRHRIAAITGTSTCFVVQSPDPIFVEGVWGPLKNTLFTGWYMGTGGQNATGELISHVLTTHPAYEEASKLAQEKGVTVHECLAMQIDKLVTERGVNCAAELIKDIFLYPDFHGNRAPLADSDMRGMWVGLTLDVSINDLALRLQATLEALALQFRHIFEEMNAAGHDIKQIFVSGGQSTNIPFLQLLADVCQIPVISPDSASSVAKGSAILGRFAFEMQANLRGAVVDTQEVSAKMGLEGRAVLWKCMSEMTQLGRVITPSSSMRETALLDAKYIIFHEMIAAQKRWRELINTALRKNYS